MVTTTLTGKHTLISADVPRMDEVATMRERVTLDARDQLRGDPARPGDAARARPSSMRREPGP